MYRSPVATVPPVDEVRLICPPEDGGIEDEDPEVSNRLLNVTTPLLVLDPINLDIFRIYPRMSRPLVVYYQHLQ